VQRPSQPVEPPDDQAIARPGHFQSEGQARPLGLGAGDPVLVDLLAAGYAQRITLQVEILVVETRA
jgi:hypothetical protein